MYQLPFGYDPVVEKNMTYEPYEFVVAEESYVLPEGLTNTSDTAEPGAALPATWTISPPLYVVLSVCAVNVLEPDEPPSVK